MSYPWELEGKLAKCWLAGTLSTKVFSRKFKSSTINDINVSQICDDIKDIVDKRNDPTSCKFSFNLSSQLLYGAIKILAYQTSSLDKELQQLEKVLINSKTADRDEEIDYEKIINPLNVCSTRSAQLDEDLHLLPDEPCIDIRYRNKMDDAACLEFGALTETEVETLERIRESIQIRSNTNLNMSSKLDMVFQKNQIWTDLEESSVDMSKNKERMSISPIHDIPVRELENQITFEKEMLPDLTVPEIERSKSNLLTPQKRQPAEKNNIETPSKRRRLRFEETTDKDEVVTERMAGMKITSVFTTDHPLEPLPDLELVQENSLQIKQKSRKKKVFDKTKKLSDETIRKWLSNVNGQTVPLTTINVNMPMSDILLNAPSTSFTSTRNKMMSERKWNNSLLQLFHINLQYNSRIIHMEDEQLLEKSSAFGHDEKRNDKTEELLSELYSESQNYEWKKTESSVHTKSLNETDNIKLEGSSILKSKPHKDISTDDLEQNLQLLSIEQSIYPDLNTHEKEKYQEALEFSQSCPLTKQDLLALLEVHWHNAEIVEFAAVISPNTYNKYDAACCYLLLLVLHNEEKIILAQRTPYDVLWIKKYRSDDISDDNSMA